MKRPATKVRERGGAKGLAVAAVAAVGVLALVLWAILGAGRDGDGPAEVAWDRQPCDECRMLVGDPAFAAQLRTEDGRVFFFDDPGCYFHFVAAEHPAIRQAWFHDLRRDRWLSRGEVAFVDAPGSPMGYDLGAVAADTPGAMTLEAARARALATGAHEHSRPEAGQ